MINSDFKKLDIQNIGIYYTTRFDNIKKECRTKYKKSDYIDINYKYLDDIINLEDIEYSFFSEIEFNKFLNEILNCYDYYIILNYNSNWRGKIGYKIVNEKEECFQRNYDCSQYIKGISKNKECVFIEEFSHDIPDGSEIIIIGSNDYNVNNMDINDIIKLANKNMKNIVLI